MTRGGLARVLARLAPRRPAGPWWAARGLLAFGLAHAVAVVLVSHCHYFVRPPTRQLWFGAELGLAALAWLPARWYVGRVLRPAYLGLTPGGRRLFAGLAVGLGFVVSRWWAGTFADTLWLHGPALRAVLEVVLAASQAAVLAAAFAGLLAATVTLDRTGRPDNPSPGPSPEGGGEDEGRLSPPSLPGKGAGGLGFFPLLAFALFLAAANAFTVWYVGREHTLYYWDYIGYWTRSADLAEAVRELPPGEVWDQFRHAARTDDYGPIPAVLPAAAAAAFGDSRLVYVLAVVNCYLAGLAAAGWLFVRRFAPSAGAAAVVAPLLLVLLSPTAWGPVLRGYLDVGGAALGVLALLVYLSRPAGELPWPRVVLLAGLLVGMALFRRWYSFFVVAFFLVAGADTAVAALRAWPRGGWRGAARRAAPLILAGVWAGVLLLSFAADWAYRAATTDYADTYAAYKMHDAAADRAWEAVNYCGLGAGAAAAAGLLVCLGSRSARRPAVLVAAMYPVMLLLFIRVQGMGPHHYNLLLPAYVLLPALALASLPGWLRWPGVAAAAAFGLAVMAAAVHPTPEVREPLGRAVSPLAYPPMTRDDLPEFRRLLRRTGEAAEEADGPVAVVASSLTVSGTMFATADRTFREPLVRRDRVLIGGEVDRVNGFPGLFLRADVLVVADPPQTHLQAGEQESIAVTAASLLTRRDIGAAFDRLPGEFHLGDGVTVSLYRRARPISQADFDAYLARLRRAHPDRPVFFTPPPGTEALLRWPRPGR
jgi:hypothetical protein